MRIPREMIMRLQTQEIFDVIAWNLLRQHARARVVHDDGRGQCRYQAPDGKRCAIGFIIPDDIYHPTLEGLRVADLAHQLLHTNFGREFARLLYRDLELLTALQQMHDRSSPAQWGVELAVIARRFGLSSMVVDEWFAPRPPALATPALVDAEQGFGDRAEACEILAA